MSVESTDYMTSLLIKQASAEDAGEYTVTAKNQWGSKKINFNINVQGKEKIR